ncbi:RagB/SusD family nutrient uptake outer membrane protein [Sphingobacterium alkalisoli]|uniref:RagB/SusD family nutrient uptake outer membrane protein n=1 Tax=Sphingobacterium alkalisoli TaxID=1874115 RepID=A0A4U0H8F6_9SPHI|nr:RagB/SusD family nutrient uptake outer membrane protein [Sphingobacterium alkalisoli]TJY68143.1 RagB/SusD family nutrient uptake outer membrane protein [Sphingobacterium alkalisoli]
MKCLVITLYTISIFLISCQEDFLDVKSDRSIGTMRSLDDYQALMDNSTAKMNSNAAHVLGLIGSDEYYLTTAVWEALTNIPRKEAYLWNLNYYKGSDGDDWNDAYSRILHTNLVLDNIDSFDASEKAGEKWKNVKGSALFFRALNFYQLAQVFCKPFSADTDDPLGLPLRLEADITLRSKRNSVKETYARVIQDLKESADLLPVTPLAKMRPSKPAAYALLARVSLLMRDYQSALTYADLALSYSDELIDYNTLNTAKPFEADYGQSNPEVLFFCYAPAVNLLGRARMHIDPELYDLYEEADLRKVVFYDKGSINNIFFKGSYHGSTPFFVGLSTSELYLIRSETYVRLNQMDQGLADLNVLRSKRFETGSYIPLLIDEPSSLLYEIITERRRELAFRGLRWEDLRRLNQEPAFARTVSKEVNGTTYELLPNSGKYVWRIPDDVIELSGIEQN